MLIKLKKLISEQLNNKQENCKLLNHSTYQPFKVRMIGVEPTCLTALDPKSSASANFATSAKKCQPLKLGGKGRAFLIKKRGV